MATTTEPLTQALQGSPPRPVNRLIGAFLAVAVVGWSAAFFLTTVHLWALPLPDGVQPQGSMEVVTSSWAYIGPIPLALVGAGYYVAMMTLGALWLTTKDPRLEQVMLPVTVIGLLSSVGLVYLQLGPIGAICPFCMVSATATATLFSLEVVIKRLGGGTAAPPASPAKVWPAVFVGAIGMAIVAVYGLTLVPIPGT